MLVVYYTRIERTFKAEARRNEKIKPYPYKPKFQATGTNQKDEAIVIKCYLLP